MKEHPILFSAPMVRAILDGRKTQTRRLILRPERFSNIRYCGFCCPYGQPGERLWVRETWAESEGAPYADGKVDRQAVYRADYSDVECGPWKPSIHMPRWASRITLEITGVRVEQLQDISERDVLAEGVDPEIVRAFDHPHTKPPREAIPAFMRLWDSINGKRAPWESNPWVWVVEFKRDAA